MANCPSESSRADHRDTMPGPAPEESGLHGSIVIEDCPGHYCGGTIDNRPLSSKRGIPSGAAVYAVGPLGYNFGKSL
jgi:hypothetical protein